MPTRSPCIQSIKKLLGIFRSPDQSVFTSFDRRISFGDELLEHRDAGALSNDVVFVPTKGLTDDFAGGLMPS